MISLGTPDDEILDDKQAIQQLVEDQLAAWNAGDLNAFLKGYSRSKACVPHPPVRTVEHARLRQAPPHNATHRARLQHTHSLRTSRRHPPPLRHQHRHRHRRPQDLTFTSGGVVMRGFEATQKRFVDAFGPPGGGGAAAGGMGTIALAAPLEIVLLSRDSAWALGSATLAPASGGGGGGGGGGGERRTTFTLIFRRTAGHGTR
jgi:hypothetical protein